MIISLGHPSSGRRWPGASPPSARAIAEDEHPLTGTEGEEDDSADTYESGPQL
jgi:hypothetical protein